MHERRRTKGCLRELGANHAGANADRHSGMIADRHAGVIPDMHAGVIPAMHGMGSRAHVAIGVCAVVRASCLA